MEAGYEETMDALEATGSLDEEQDMDSEVNGNTVSPLDERTRSVELEDGITSLTHAHSQDISAIRTDDITGLKRPYSDEALEVSKATETKQLKSLGDVKIENTISNCPGAVFADTVHQNTFLQQSNTLQSIKENTRSSLDNIDVRNLFETRAIKKAKYILERHNSVIISGTAEHPKTTMALHLAKLMPKTHYPVELISPDQWDHLLPEENYVIMIDVLLGTDDNVVGTQWNKVLKQILNRILTGKVILILVCSQALYEKSWIRDMDFDRFHVNLCSEDLRLRTFEKVAILEKVLSGCRVEFTRQELFGICTEAPDAMFFESCAYFKKFYKTKKLSIGFFREPFHLVSEKYQNMSNQNRTRLLKVALESLGETVDETDEYFFELGLDNIDLDFDSSSNWQLSLFLTKSEGHYRFTHNCFLECAFLILSTSNPELFVRLCKMGVLAKYTTVFPVPFDASGKASTGKVFLDRDVYPSLSNRIAEALQTDMDLILGHDCFSEELFLRILCSLHEARLKSLDVNRLLYNAVSSDHIEFLKILLKVSDRECKGFHSLLHHALSLKRGTICKILLDAGEKLQPCCFLHLCKSRDMLTELQSRYSISYPDMIQCLEAGDLENSCKELIGSGNFGFLGDILQVIQQRAYFVDMKRSLLRYACRYGHCDSFVVIMGTGDPLPSYDFLLPCAAEGGCMELVNKLLENGTNPNTMNEGGFPPLYLACEGNYLGVALRLVESGADINTKSPLGEGVLHACSSLPPGSKMSTLKWLLKEHINMLNLENTDKHGRTPLHTAAFVGNPSTLKLLLQHGAHQSSHDFQGNTPAHCHVMGENFDPEILRLLHDNKADLDARNGNGQTPIQVLVKNNKTDRCRLLQYLAVVTKELNSKQTGQTCLQSLLMTGCNIEEAEILIESGADISTSDLEGNTILHLVAELRDPRFVSFIVTKGGNVLSKNKRDQTPLHLAVRISENLGVIQELLKVRGFDPQKDVRGNTPLQITCKESVEGSEGYVIPLLSHFPVDVTNDLGKNALHLAAESNGPDARRVTELLLENGAGSSIVDNQTRTALHIASSSCQRHSSRIIQLLLNDGADINLTCNNKDTPLHIACSSDGPYKAEVISTLVDNRARLNQTNINGLTAIDIALIKGDSESAKAVTNALIMAACLFGKYHGYDLLGPWENGLSSQEDGQTLLHTVCNISGKHSARLVRELVTDCRCRVNARNIEGKTPLHIACETSGEYGAEIVAELLALGANVNAIDDAGHSALHMASAAQSEEAQKVVQVLLRGNSRIDARDKDGNTPLHTACIQQTSVIQELINFGANTERFNNSGLSPFDLLQSIPSRTEHAQMVLYSNKLKNFCNGDTELKEKGVEHFLSKGASLNHRHANGNTILHELSQQKGGVYTLSNITLLLSLGADPHIKNNNDQTPQDLAACSNNLKVAELLVEKEKTVSSTSAKSGARSINATEMFDYMDGFYDKCERSSQRTADEAESEDVAFFFNLLSNATPIARAVVDVGRKFVDAAKKLDK